LLKLGVPTMRDVLALGPGTWAAVTAVDPLAALHRLRAIVAQAGDAEAAALLETLIQNAPASAPGQRTPATIDALAARNSELRRAAQEHALSAVELHKLLSRYHVTSWRRDRLAAECPAHLAGRVEARLWSALKAHDYPPGPKQLERILGHELPLFVSKEVAQDEDSEGGNDVFQVQKRIRRSARRSA
jgi:hypothetical protein